MTIAHPMEHHESPRRPGRPLRVLQLIQYFEVGGIERMVLTLARRGAEHGVSTTVVAYSGDGEFRQAFDDAGVPTHFFETRPGLQVKLPLKLAALIQRGRYDVVHSHHLGPFLYGGAAARLTRRPHVHTEHSRELYDTPRRRLIGHAMPRVATVLTVTPELTEWRARHFGDRPEVVENGVPVPELTSDQRAEARRRLELAEDAFVVGCVARLGAEKDHFTLVDAMAKLREQVPSAVAVLAGDGPERRAIEQRVGERGLTDSVRLLGNVPDIERIYPALDVISLSSRREGLPLALLEGMAHGIPAVATEVGGIPALLREGGGLTCAPCDPAALAAQLALYAGDAERRRADGETARQRVTRHHSEEAMVNRYVNLYRRVVRRPAR